MWVEPWVSKDYCKAYLLASVHAGDIPLVQEPQEVDIVKLTLPSCTFCFVFFCVETVLPQPWLPWNSLC